jgi:hypothetical protein
MTSHAISDETERLGPLGCLEFVFERGRSCRQSV